MESKLREIIKSISAADAAAVKAAEERQAKLAKPPGSLGVLEDISVKLAGITGQVKNRVDNTRILVFAADNGVVSEGVSCTPRSVTASQVMNMTRHKTGMSTLAKEFGCSIEIYDMGIATPYNGTGIINRSLGAGTANIAEGAAMTREACVTAIMTGIEAADRAAADGIQAVGIGEMGIGNTTTSACVLAALTGSDAQQVCGRGGGLTDTAFEHKKEVVARALEVNKPQRDDPIDVLAKVGGFDLAAMTGAFIGCAKSRIAAVADGYISTVAALCAVRLCPAVRDYIFLSHASFEVGCRIAQEALDLKPCLLLGMRLGEGSGCPIMFQVMRAACSIICDMASFEEAAINDSYLEEIRRIDGFTVKK